MSWQGSSLSSTLAQSQRLHITTEMSTLRMSSASPTKIPRRPISPNRIFRKPVSPNRNSGQNFTAQDSPVRGRKSVPRYIQQQVKIQNTPKSPVHIQFNQLTRPVSCNAEVNDSWIPNHRQLSSSDPYYSAPEYLYDTTTTTGPQTPPHLQPFFQFSPGYKKNNFLGDFSMPESYPDSLGEVMSQFGAEKMAESPRPSTAPNLLTDENNQHMMEEEVESFQYHHLPKPERNQSAEPNSRTRRIPEPLKLNAENTRSFYPSLNPGHLRSVSSNPAFADHRVRGRSPGGLEYIPRSPGLRVSSAHSNRSFSRPASSPNTSAPQSPIFKPLEESNSALREVVGTNALLLPTKDTIAMYQKNLRKSDKESQYAFAMLLIRTAKDLEQTCTQNSSSESLNKKNDRGRKGTSGGDCKEDSPSDLYNQAHQVLKSLASRSYPFAQYYLADGYSSGLFCNNRKPDNYKAFPLFLAANKHGHSESGFRVAICYEHGWGTRVDPAKAVHNYRSSAAKGHTGAMARLGKSLLRGDLGVKEYREGLKWLRRATETACEQFNDAPFELGCLHENGYGDDVFKDEEYTAQLFTQAADLGHVEAALRMGEAYELGNLKCPRNPRLSVHFYTRAAQGGSAKAMYGLCAWYMLGIENFMEVDEDEAFEWARKAAHLGLFSNFIAAVVLLQPLSSPNPNFADYLLEVEFYLLT